MPDNQDHAEDALTASEGHASIPFKSIKNQLTSPGQTADSGNAPSTHSRWRRRKTLVNHEHQLRFTTVLLVQMTSVLMAIAGFAYLESQRTMAVVLRYLDAFPVQTHELHQGNQSFLFGILVLVALAACVQVSFGIVMSHKLAGPIVKMTRVLQAVTAGDYTARVGFRKGDDLDTLGASMNRMLDTLTGEQRRSRVVLDRVQGELERLAGGDPNGLIRLQQQLCQLAGIQDVRPAAVSDEREQEVVRG